MDEELPPAAVAAGRTKRPAKLQGCRRRDALFGGMFSSRQTPQLPPIRMDRRFGIRSDSASSSAVVVLDALSLWDFTDYNAVQRMAQVWHIITSWLKCLNPTNQSGWKGISNRTNWAGLLFRMVAEFVFFGTDLTPKIAICSKIFHDIHWKCHSRPTVGMILVSESEKSGQNTNMSNK